ncbi:MAG: hypothetical protein JKY56_15115 [Kofleriaceae bacterium]|nr:hypothetical protein [Kofleriaceae bacterium]
MQRYGARALLTAALLTAIAACKSPEPQFSLNCDELYATNQSGIGFSAAQQAFVHAETTRMLRYQEALDPGYFMRTSREFVQQSKIDRGALCFEQLRVVGRLLFEHEYSFADGLGSTDAKSRPDPFRRVHKGSFGGPETIACVSCHWRGGEAGAGALQDNSMINGDGINTYTSEARNPPSLLGSGVVQALAQEMSAELQTQRAAAVDKAQKSGKTQEVKLTSKGILFGNITVESNGEIDTSELSGVDSDLVIKAFGWRGEFATIRQFAMTSTQVHLGIQSEDLLLVNAKMATPRDIGTGPAQDPDNDGVTNEFTSGQLTSLVLYLASLPMPILVTPEEEPDATALSPGIANLAPKRFEERFLAGQEIFENIGCAICHSPVLVLSDPTFKTTSRTTGKTYSIDLSKEGRHPRLQYSESHKGYPVWLFSDMKRHDLGERAGGKAQEKSDHGQIGDNEFLTRRLWGLGESSPYFYDGRAPTVSAAIMAHDGEAAFAREEFDDLQFEDKANLRLFLLGLGRSKEFVVP